MLFSPTNQIMLIKLPGLVPIPTEDGVYTPLRLALRLVTKPRTDEDGTVLENVCKGNELENSTMA